MPRTIRRRMKRRCAASMKRFMHDTFREQRVFRVLFSASSLLPFMRSRLQRLQFCNSGVVFLDEHMEKRSVQKYHCHMQWHNMEIHMCLRLDGMWVRTTVVPETTDEQFAYSNLVRECMESERKRSIKLAKQEFKKRKEEKSKPTIDVHFKCCICQEEHMGGLCALQCGHVMHSECVASCKKCPLCKQTITTRTKLFL